MLKIEDVKVGDELVCIDRDGFLSTSGSSRHSANIKEIIKSKIIISHVYKDFVELKNTSLFLNDFDLKYFKKKEQSQYTFDDLIDVASKAVKDGLFKLIKTDLKSVISLFDSYDFDEEPSLVFHNDEHNQTNHKYIQSLYKETFVIECEEDCKRIKQNAKITFLNGNSVVMDQPPVGDGIVRIWNDGRYDFAVLKGATVEQSRND